MGKKKKPSSDPEVSDLEKQMEEARATRRALAEQLYPCVDGELNTIRDAAWGLGVIREMFTGCPSSTNNPYAFIDTVETAFNSCLKDLDGALVDLSETFESYTYESIF